MMKPKRKTTLERDQDDNTDDLDTLHGIVTFISSQNAAAFISARSALQQLGIEYDLLRVHTGGHPARILWRLWKRLKTGQRSFDEYPMLLRELLRKRRPDFVILKPASLVQFRPFVAYAVMLLCRLRDVPLFVNWGNCGWNLRKLDQQTDWLAKRIAMRVIRSPDVHHLAPTHSCLSDAQEWASFSGGQVIGNAPIIERGYDSLHVPTDPPTVVNVASVQPRKGTDLFVDVALAVVQRHPTVRFLWIGGEPDASTQERIQSMHAEDRILFVHKARPPFEYYRHASAVLFTSRSEAFGLTVAEAMALGRTVLCFAGTGASEVVGDAGVVVPRFEVPLMVSEILRLLEQEPESRLNLRARSRYEHLYSPTAFATNLTQRLRVRARRTVRYN